MRGVFMGFFSDLWRSMVLREQTTTEQGYTSAIERTDLLGNEGVVKNELRPAGTAIFDSEPIDVVSEGEYIVKGEKVVVIGVNGGRVVVRRVEGDA